MNGARLTVEPPERTAGARRQPATTGTLPLHNLFKGATLGCKYHRTLLTRTGRTPAPHPRCSSNIMEMKKINSGKLRAIGYDARARILQVQLDNGDTLQYSGVGDDLWRRLSSSAAAWSFYRDNIEEEFTAKKVSGSAAAKKNPLDDLFG